MAGDKRGSTKATLNEYSRKRDFDKTPEPRGARDGGEGESGTFVIQHHRASSDHYDFRLEVDGALKSWAVPKGPSTDPREKRLAVPTEDHPVEYASFEGTIPENEYGGGTVQVWDHGTYQNTTTRERRDVSMGDGIEAGHVSFRLHGEKLTGGYALNRFRTGDDEAWLLVKERDDHADARRNPVHTQQASALTGRSMDEIAAEED